jgi:hypothetical protein
MFSSEYAVHDLWINCVIKPIKVAVMRPAEILVFGEIDVEKCA